MCAQKQEELVSPISRFESPLMKQLQAEIAPKKLTLKPAVLSSSLNDTSNIGLFATDAIPASTTVLQAQPYAAVVGDDHLAQICSACFARNKPVKRCSNCKIVYYCSPQCQRGDWIIAHQVECKAFVRLADHRKALTPTVRLIFRSLVRKKEASEHSSPLIFDIIQELLCDDWNFVQAEDSQKYVSYLGMATIVRKLLGLKTDSDLTAHCLSKNEFNNNEIMKNENNNNNNEIMKNDCEINIKSEINQKNDDRVNWSQERIARLISKLSINGFGVGNFDKPDVGYAWYGVPSFINHSCNPNCAPSFCGNRLCITTVYPIREGEQLFINYIDLGLPTKLRHRQLEGFRFVCKCLRCESFAKTDAPSFTVVCPSCTSFVPPPLAYLRPALDSAASHPPTTCPKCKTIIDVAEIEDSAQRMAEKANIAQPLSVKKVTSMLAPTHHISLSMHHTLYLQALDVEQYEQAANFLRVLLKNTFQYPEFAFHLGLRWYSLGMLLRLSADLPSALGALKKAWDILSRSQGSDHPDVVTLSNLIQETHFDISQITQTFQSTPRNTILK